MDACRSSGVLTSSKVIAAHPCRLKSIHFAGFAAGGDSVLVQVYDSKDSTLTGNTELARIVIDQNNQSATNVEYDMHGVLAREGLYLKVTATAACGSLNAETRQAISVEFN